MTYFHRYTSPLGNIVLISDGAALTGLWFEDSKNAQLTDDTVRCDDLSIFQTADRWLDAYFAGRQSDFLPPIALNGTPFQQSVWQMLLNIPYGKTRTYGEIAAELARKQGRSHLSAQAVGGAVGHNPILITVPCHRVIGADGSLTGYAGGLRRKEKLLALEGALK